MIDVGLSFIDEDDIGCGDDEPFFVQSGAFIIPRIGESVSLISWAKPQIFEVVDVTYDFTEMTAGSKVDIVVRRKVVRRR